MNNQIQVVLKSSTTEMSLNDHDSGIYIVPELNGLTGLPDIRTTSGVNAGYDGGWTSAQNYDARSITLRGVIANEDKATVERMRKQLVSLLGQGKNEELTLDIVTEAGSAYEIQVRTIACEMAMQRVLTQQEFMIQLRADDPLIYDNTEAGEPAIVQVQKALGGFQIPFEIPLAIGGGEDASVIDNHGLEQVAPIVKMYGALHNPKIINQTTNQYMQIEADLGYAEGAYTDAETSDSGQNISFDAPIAAPLADFSLKGNTEQTTYTGKNLLKLTPQASTSNGITATLTDGIINYSGTASSNWANIAARTYNSIPAGNYMLSMQETFATNYAYAISVTYTDNTTATFECWKSVSNKRTVTLAKDVASYYVYLTGLTSGTSYSGTISLMLESGSTATTPFEPYTNGPSPNPDYPQAVQTVTGENVVKICKKNLFDVSAIPYVAKRAYGADGTELIWNNYSGIDGYQQVAPNTTYTITKGASGSVSYLCEYDKNKAFIQRKTDQRTFTTTANTHYLRWSVYSQGDVAPTQTQLELGSATAYEPYQGQSYEINLGKNLFDAANADVKTGYILNNSGVEVSDNTGGYTRNYSVVKPNTTYTISGLVNAGTRRIYYYDGAKNFISRSDGSGASSWQFTTPANCHYVNVQIYTNTDNSTSMASWQIEIGSQATDFAAYFTPIELCKIGDYQDYIWKDGDIWKVHKAIGKVVVKGNEGGWLISAATTSTNYYYARTNALDNLSIPNYYGGYCDRFTNRGTYIQGSDTVSTDVYSLGSPSYSLRMLILGSRLSAMTTAAFETFLTSNPATIYYALATPTDTAITNSALIEQLDAILNSGRVYEGTNNITTVIAAGNAQGEVQVSYYTHQDPATRDEIIIDSRLRTITLNGLDIYDKKTDGSEFLMLAPGENKLMLQSDIDGDNGYAEVNYKQGYLSI